MVLPGNVATKVTETIHWDELLTPGNCWFFNHIPDKKTLFRQIAHAMKKPKLLCETIFKALWQRERLGNTILSEWIAIPHALMPIEQILACFIYSKRACDYDGQPIHLCISLLVPKHYVGAKSLIVEFSQMMPFSQHLSSLTDIQSQSLLYAWLKQLIDLAASQNNQQNNSIT